jgi:hypothetical protein
MIEDTPRPSRIFPKESAISKVPNGTKLKKNTSIIPVAPPIRLKKTASKRN